MDMQMLREFFKWCVVINLVLFVWTTIMSIWCRRLLHRTHGKLFELKPETINATLYRFLAFYKVVFIVFVLVPWLALLIMTK